MEYHPMRISSWRGLGRRRWLALASVIRVPRSWSESYQTLIFRQASSLWPLTPAVLILGIAVQVPWGPVNSSLAIALVGVRPVAMAVWWGAGGRVFFPEVRTLPGLPGSHVHNSVPHHVFLTTCISEIANLLLRVMGFFEL